MLDITLATEFVPGTNLKGDVAGANWSYLLPSLELERILCVGVADAAALATLARIGREVLVLCERTRQFDEVGALSRQRGLANVRPIRAERPGESPIPAGSVDLIYLGAGGHDDPEILPLSARFLKSDGMIYFEAGDRAARLGDSAGSRQRFWVTPLSGEMRTAVPAEDRRTIDYFVRNALYSPSVRLRLRPLKRVERLLNRRLAASGLAR